MDPSSSSAAAVTRRSRFAYGDDGLASLADIEAGFPVTGQKGIVSAPLCHTIRNSVRNLYPGVSSPRSVVSGRFYDWRFENHHQPHFLDSCFFCKKPLGDNRDIFMYRGDTPFCSEECRQEQIDIDEAKEKKYSLSSSMKALRRKEKRKSTSPNKAQGYSFHTGTVAAA